MLKRTTRLNRCLQDLDSAQFQLKHDRLALGWNFRMKGVSWVVVRVVPGPTSLARPLPDQASGHPGPNIESKKEKRYKNT